MKIRSCLKVGVSALALLFSPLTLQAEVTVLRWPSGSTAFDVNMVPTCSINKYAPLMLSLTLSDKSKAVFAVADLEAMRFEGMQYGIPTDLSLLPH